MSDFGCRMEGQVALITEAGRGLGRGFSIGLAAAGMRVAAVARSADQVAETVRLIEASGGSAVALRADVSDPVEVHRMAQEARDRLGPIDLLINNAGAGGPFGPTWEADPADWWRAFETNMRGSFLCAGRSCPGWWRLATGGSSMSPAAQGHVPYLICRRTSRARPP